MEREQKQQIHRGAGPGSLPRAAAAAAPAGLEVPAQPRDAALSSGTRAGAGPGRAGASGLA